MRKVSSKQSQQKIKSAGKSRSNHTTAAQILNRNQIQFSQSRYPKDDSNHHLASSYNGLKQANQFPSEKKITPIKKPQKIVMTCAQNQQLQNTGFQLTDHTIGSFRDPKNHF
jgi:hypothetical protein